MARIQRVSSIVAFICAASVLAGCDINGEYPEGDSEAINYGLDLQRVVSKYLNARSGLEPLRDLIDLDIDGDSETPPAEAKEALDHLRALREERVSVERRLQVYFREVQDAVVQLDLARPPLGLRHFHDTFRSELLTRSETWRKLPTVIDQIVEETSFEAGRRFIEQDAADHIDLDHLIPKDFMYRNPWLDCASRMKVQEPKGWFTAFWQTALIGIFGAAAVGYILWLPVLGIWILAVAASRRLPALEWPSRAVVLVAASVGTSCIGAGAAGLSLELSHPIFSVPRWLAALILLAGMVLWWFDLFYPQTFYAVMEDGQFGGPKPGESLMLQTYGDDPVKSRLISVVHYAILPGFAAFFWAYFAPESLSYPWLWFFQKAS